MLTMVETFEEIDGTTPPPADDAAPRPCLLVCEGRCNPSIDYIDRMTAREYAQYGAISRRVRELQRSLRLTMHDPVTVARYSCRFCGRRRDYGRMD